MDTRYLNYILVLAETGNMTRAAERLFISQPTLSQFLAKQEHELGMPLFQRHNGVFTLTPAGKLYADYAKEVIGLTEQLKSNLQNLQHINKIYIGTSSTRSLKMVNSILGEFRSRYPQVELNIFESPIDVNSRLIEQNRLDIAFITASSLEPWKNYSLELKKEEVVLAVSDERAACFSASLEPESFPSLTGKELMDHFKDTPFILQRPGSCIRTLIDTFLGKQDFSPLIACTTSNVQSILDMAASNIGIGFIPVCHIRPNAGIRYFSLKPKLYRTHAILCRPTLTMQPTYQCLINLAVKYAKEHW